MLEAPRHRCLLPQVCSKREKRLADPTLEKYVLTVVLDTINAFFSSPFSENSTSLQVSCSCSGGFCVGKGEKRNIYSYLLVMQKDTMGGYTRVLGVHPVSQMTPKFSSSKRQTLIISVSVISSYSGSSTIE